MKDAALEKDLPKAIALTDEFIEESFDRVTGAELLHNNEVKLLIDAAENYPAWYEAIESATERIFFESYIIHEDAEGNKFADLLIKKANEGIEIKLIYDWMGGWGRTSRKFWKRLRAAGIEVRSYNPPNILDPLSLFSRDHRKMLAVDGRVGFISGLCIGQDWIGHPEKQIPPWRDTGVEIRGSAVADVERAFAEAWAMCGTPLDVSKLSKREDFPKTGKTALRVIQNVPSVSHTYRIDKLLAAGVRETMWITDAYFVGTPDYLESLKDAAADGVDVRILVPQSTDIPVVGETTRTTYRSLLEAGIKVYEWNGSMVHSKTAVFDGKFSRVGSTNLNIASWFGNLELDVLVEDEDFGRRMMEVFLKDLENSTEIVLAENQKVLPRRDKKKRLKGKGSGSMRKATAGALNTATSLGSALTKKTPLGASESKILFAIGGGLVVIAVLLLIFPRILSIPIAVILLLPAMTLLTKAVKYYRKS